MRGTTVYLSLVASLYLTYELYYWHIFVATSPCLAANSELIPHNTECTYFIFTNNTLTTKRTPTISSCKHYPWYRVVKYVMREAQWSRGWRTIERNSKVSRSLTNLTRQIRSSAISYCTQWNGCSSVVLDREYTRLYLNTSEIGHWEESHMWQHGNFALDFDHFLLLRSKDIFSFFHSTTHKN